MNSWRKIRHCWEQNQGAEGLGSTSLCPSWDHYQVAVFVSCRIWSLSPHVLPWHTHANAHSRQWRKLWSSPQRHRAQVPRICWCQKELEPETLQGAASRCRAWQLVLLPEHHTGHLVPGKVPWWLYLELSNHRNMTFIKDPLPHQNKDFVTWVAVFPTQYLVGT